MAASRESPQARGRESTSVTPSVPLQSQRGRDFANDVALAMGASVPLLVVHEAPGMDAPEARGAVPFRVVLRETPQHLVARGIYHMIAIALKAGEWRKVSHLMLAQELADGAGGRGQRRLGSVAWLRIRSRAKPKKESTHVQQATVPELESIREEGEEGDSHSTGVRASPLAVHVPRVRLPDTEEPPVRERAAVCVQRTAVAPPILRQISSDAKLDRSMSRPVRDRAPRLRSVPSVAIRDSLDGRADDAVGRNSGRRSSGARSSRGSFGNRPPPDPVVFM